MNNKKYSKIIVFALSLALIIGAAVGIVANAESAESAPEILAKNIEYGDTLKFMVAIDSESVGGEGKTVTFSVYEGDPDNNGKMLGKSATAVYKDTSETNLGVDFAYIGTATYGISPLAYGENYYLVVECDGAKTVTQYSAIEYFLERLYGDDIINATEEKELLQKEIYENAIAYGSSVQKYAAYEGKFSGTNVADYNYVKVEGGTINGASTAVLADGEYTVTFTGSAPAGLTHIGWTVTVGEDSADFTGNSVTVSESCTVTPKYQSSVVTLKPGEMFDDGRVVNATTGYITNSSGTNTRVCYYKTNTGIAGMQSGDAIEIVEDPDASKSGNKVLKFTDGSASDYTSVHITASPDYYEGSSDNKNNKGIKTTFETLLYIEEYQDNSFFNSQTVAQPMFTYGGRSTALQFNITYSTENGKFYFAPNSTGAVMTTLFNESNYFSANEWVAIRFEWYQYDLRAEEQAIIKLYINNVHVANITPPAAMLTAKGTSGEELYATKDVDHMMWKGVSTSKAVMYFDNISMYDAYIDQTIVETPAE